MRVVIAGAHGQVGCELARSAPDGVTLVQLDVDELDITQADVVRVCVKDTAPDIVVNAAAYTAVDGAEVDRETAFAVNEAGARNLAEAARSVGARMVHYSTDFIFDGVAGTPYGVGDAANPLSVYGASKWAGEEAVRGVPELAVQVLRTSWVYSSHGGNFAKTMLRLFRERGSVRVVSDQVGSPTYARDLARVTWSLMGEGAVGSAETLHVTNPGVASWYDFAVAIGEVGLDLGLLESRPEVAPIRSEEYPTPARRPSYSVLDSSGTWERIGYRLPHWRAALGDMLAHLKENPDA